MRFFIFFSLIAFFFSAIGLFQIKSYVQEINKKLLKTKKDIKELYYEIHILEAEWNYLNRPDRLEELASKYLKDKNIILAQQIYKDVDSLQTKENVIVQNVN